MKRSVFGLADNERQAQRIVDQLLVAGFDNDAISIILADAHRVNGQGFSKGAVGHEKHTKAPEGATTGAVSGGILGGSIGLLAGLGALAIPGLGPFIAAGPIMAALAGTGLFGGLGMLVGALVGMGIPEYEAKRYEDHLKAGGVLISVHTDSSEEVERATDLLKNEGAKDISTSYEKATSRM